MKHGRALTKKQAILLKSKHLNPDNWLLERNTPDVVIFVNRYSGRTISIHKEKAI